MTQTLDVQRDNLTDFSSAASEMIREDLLVLRYERRLPLAMKGITMEGVHQKTLLSGSSHGGGGSLASSGFHPSYWRGHSL